MKFVLSVSLALGIMATMTAAFAQSLIPDLRGTWVGKLDLIAADDNITSHQKRFHVFRQEGRRLEIAERYHNHPSTINLGYIRSDNVSVILVDHKATLLGTVKSTDELEICYTEIGQEMAVGCGLFRRESRK